MASKKFVVRVDGLHLNDGKMLMLKRAKDPFRGFWSLVGGHVEGTEGLKEALRREFKEETNLDVEVGSLPAAERQLKKLLASTQRNLKTAR